MKFWLAPIVLLSAAQFAHADVTLTFKEIIHSGLVTYSIKNQQIKLIQSNEKRANLFDEKKQQFVSFEPESGKQSIINKDILDKRVAQLNQQRLKKLAQVELQLAKKLQTMSAEEQQVGESLVNVLKYPESYGAHTQLRVKKSNKSKQIQNINCDVYTLFRTKHRLKEFCVAAPSALKINTRDYQTLRSFYAFNYNMQTRLLLAMGKTQFTLVDYEQEKIPGIVIETISYKGADITQHIILESVDTAAIADAAFKRPN
ncbi:hypothetical protein MNBD_GAMMA08-2622 [hydrothermal vent metagenome]|uniref:DUF4412 domain-containing protein n=1 Tax=hydrothermal vent metagenome TaxID=652676 RepID=A0A3B0XTJ7_9ZZZZ